MKKNIIVILAIIALYSCAKKIAPTTVRLEPDVNNNKTAPVVPTSQAATQIQNGNATEVTKASNNATTTHNDVTLVNTTTKETPQIQTGKSVYNAKCGKCHDLMPPQNYTEARWVKIMDWMAPKAKLSAEEKENVTAYVNFYAKK